MDGVCGLPRHARACLRPSSRNVVLARRPPRLLCCLQTGHVGGWAHGPRPQPSPHFTEEETESRLHRKGLRKGKNQLRGTFESSRPLRACFQENSGEAGAGREGSPGSGHRNVPEHRRAQRWGWD